MRCTEDWAGAFRALSFALTRTGRRTKLCTPAFPIGPLFYRGFAHARFSHVC